MTYSRLTELQYRPQVQYTYSTAYVYSILTVPPTCTVDLQYRGRVQ